MALPPPWRPLSRCETVARSAEGVARVESGAGEKRKSRVKKRLSLRGAKRRGNPHPLYTAQKYTAVRKRNGFPRPVTSVTGLGMTDIFFILPCLFPNGTSSTPAPPQSAAGRQRLAAARSRRGSDMPPACHSLPRRRCTTLVGAALRGKDLGLANRMRRTILAPLLGELAR